jgi:hypothetical protein
MFPFDNVLLVAEVLLVSLSHLGQQLCVVGVEAFLMLMEFTHFLGHQRLKTTHTVHKINSTFTLILTTHTNSEGASINRFYFKFYL